VLSAAHVQLSLSQPLVWLGRPKWPFGCFRSHISANRKSSTPSQGGLAQDPRGGLASPSLEHLVYLVISRPSTASGKACRTSIDGRYGLNSFVPSYVL
jgi:hypothetical protein